MDNNVSLDLEVVRKRLQGYFTSHYALHGRDWLARLPEHEKQAFSYVGRMHSQHGKLGGKVRARAARRDEKGRFLPCQTI